MFSYNIIRLFSFLILKISFLFDKILKIKDVKKGFNQYQLSKYFKLRSFQDCFGRSLELFHRKFSNDHESRKSFNRKPTFFFIRMQRYRL